MSNDPKTSQNHKKSVENEGNFNEFVATIRKSSSTQSDNSFSTIGSDDSGVSFNDNLKYKFRSYVQEKRKHQLWAVEFNTYLARGAPNIFAVVGGPQFSIYESMPNGKIKLQMCYQDPDAAEDFYTCCWSLNEKINTSILVVAGVRGIIRIFDLDRKNAKPKHLIGHGSAVNQLKIPSQKPFLLASASKDRSIRLWNIMTKVCIATFHSIGAHRDEVISIDFNRDCTRLISGGLDHMIAIWDLTIPDIASTIEKSKLYDENKSSRAIKTVYHPFPIFSSRLIHSNYIDSVQWHNELILSKSNENDLFCWAPSFSSDDGTMTKCSETFTVIAEFPVQNCNYYFTRFATSYDRSVLALGNGIGIVRLWNLDCTDPTHIPMVTLTHSKCTKNIRDLSFSRCSRDLVFCSDDGTIWLYQR